MLRETSKAAQLRVACHARTGGRRQPERRRIGIDDGRAFLALAHMAAAVRQADALFSLANATVVPASLKTAISAGTCSHESPSIVRGSEGLNPSSPLAAFCRRRAIGLSRLLSKAR
jgi:hypothetical protein